MIINAIWARIVSGTDNGNSKGRWSGGVRVVYSIRNKQLWKLPILYLAISHGNYGKSMGTGNELEMRVFLLTSAMKSGSSNPY